MAEGLLISGLLWQNGKADRMRWAFEDGKRVLGLRALFLQDCDDFKEVTPLTQALSL